MGSASSKDADGQSNDINTETIRNNTNHPISNLNINPTLKLKSSAKTTIPYTAGDNGINIYDEKDIINKNKLTETNNIVPMVFRWEHGGRNAYITGTFNDWSKKVPMHRSGNDFTYIVSLERGKHAYKFVIDDEWRFSPDQPTITDAEGNITNYIDVTDFKPLSDFNEQDVNASGNDDSYDQFMPDIDDYTKEPPPLPPHLRHIILNKVPPSVDSRLLPVPQHVALNHLYCTAIKDGMMVLGITQRYKQKFVTTVYYSVMPGTK